MKRCPECRRDYYDDTLSFCLEDGTPLVYGVPADEPVTAILSEPPAVVDGLTRPTDQLGEPATLFLPRGAEAEPQNLGEPSERQTLSAHQAAEPQGKIDGRSRLLLALGIAVLLLVVGFFGYRYFTPGGEQITSIAVLPFENKSGDADSDYLSDGIAESLIYRLSQVPNLKVSPKERGISVQGQRDRSGKGRKRSRRGRGHDRASGAARRQPDDQR